jgi:hypothetical protein
MIRARRVVRKSRISVRRSIPRDYDRASRFGSGLGDPVRVPFTVETPVPAVLGLMA